VDDSGDVDLDWLCVPIQTGKSQGDYELLPPGPSTSKPRLQALKPEPHDTADVFSEAVIDDSLLPS